MVKHS
jgi:hypothetical protein